MLAVYDRAFDLPGVEVYWAHQSSGGRAVNKLANKELEMAVLGSSPLAFGLARGVPFTTVYTVHSKGTSQGLLVRDGIGVVTPRDLIGKTIAFPRVSTTHYHLNVLYDILGIDPSLSTLISMQPNHIIQAWDAGEIDAAACWGTAMNHVLGNGGSMLVPASYLSSWGYETFNALVTRNDFGAAHPEVVQRVVDMFMVLDQEFNTNPTPWGLGTPRLDKLVRVTMGHPAASDPAKVAEAGRRLHMPEFFPNERQLSCRYLARPIGGGTCFTEGLGTNIKLTADFLFSNKVLKGPLPLATALANVDASYAVRAAASGLTIASLGTAKAYPPLLQGPGTPCAAATAVTAATGGFSDGHGVNGSYAPNSACSWTFTRTSSAVTTLTFTLVSLERAADWVRVFGGPGTAYLLAEYTGRLGSSAPTVRAAGPLRVDFKSDREPDQLWGIVAGGEGFSLTYDDSRCASDADCGGAGRGSCDTGSGLCKCSVGYFGADCSAQQCTGTKELLTTTGSLSHGAATPYANNRNCRWVIKPPGGASANAVVVLTFASLALEKGWDKVEVYSGDAVDAAKHVGTVTGNTPPPPMRAPIDASTGAVLVVFKSDAVHPDNGFRLNFAVSAIAGCSTGSDCNGHGTCVATAADASLKSCVCDLGFFGPRCAHTTCVADSGTASGVQQMSLLTQAASHVGSYDNDATCQWTFLPPPGPNGGAATGVEVIVHRLDTEPSSHSFATDTLTVSALGATPGSSTLLRTLSRPADISCRRDESCGGGPNVCNKTRPDALSGTCTCGGGYHGALCEFSPRGMLLPLPASSTGGVSVVFHSDSSNPPGTMYSGISLMLRAYYPCPNDCGGFGECILGLCECRFPHSGDSCESFAVACDNSDYSANVSGSCGATSALDVSFTLKSDSKCQPLAGGIAMEAVPCSHLPAADPRAGLVGGLAMAGTVISALCALLIVVMWATGQLAFDRSSPGLSVLACLGTALLALSSSFGVDAPRPEMCVGADVTFTLGFIVTAVALHPLLRRQHALAHARLMLKTDLKLLITAAPPAVLLLLLALLATALAPPTAVPVTSSVTLKSGHLIDITQLQCVPSGSLVGLAGSLHAAAWVFMALWVALILRLSLYGGANSARIDVSAGHAGLCITLAAAVLAVTMLLPATHASNRITARGVAVSLLSILVSLRLLAARALSSVPCMKRKQQGGKGKNYKTHPNDAGAAASSAAFSPHSEINGESTAGGGKQRVTLQDQEALQLYRHPVVRECVFTFLTENMVDELPLFVRAVEAYTECYENNSWEPRQSNELMASAIMGTHVREGSKFQVNLAGSVVTALERSFADGPTPAMFGPAMKVMRRQALSRMEDFKRTKHARDAEELLNWLEPLGALDCNKQIALGTYAKDLGLKKRNVQAPAATGAGAV